MGNCPPLMMCFGLASEEFSEDMQKMGGTEALDEPYLEMPILRLFQEKSSVVDRTFSW
jgi:hypothetical protein